MPMPWPGDIFEKYPQGQYFDGRKVMESNWLPTIKDVEFFESEGYWIAPVLIADEQLEALRAHMELVFQGQFETGRAPWQGYWSPEHGNVLRKTDNSHWADRTIQTLALDSRIGEIAARLMKAPTIRLWHDQLLHKPGQAPGASATNVGWHQDYQYWQCAEKPTLLTAWVAFDDVDLNNGCMQFIPRSNQWGLASTGDFFDQNTASQWDRINRQHPEAQPLPVVLKAGQVSFHHCLTFHGSGPNFTERPRRSLAIHLMTGDTRYRVGTDSDGHMNVLLLHPSPGQTFAGPEFPVIFSKE